MVRLKSCNHGVVCLKTSSISLLVFKIQHLKSSVYQTKNVDHRANFLQQSNRKSFSMKIFMDADNIKLNKKMWKNSQKCCQTSVDTGNML